jgi:hypothetical protein
LADVTDLTQGSSFFFDKVPIITFYYA